MRIVIVGPVFPYRAGIAYCTTELAAQLAQNDDVRIESFSRQYPKFLYPGGDDTDSSLRSRRPANARFDIDILNPISWLRAAWRLRRDPPDAVIVVWWIWIWALPYRVILSLLPRRTRVVLQCHNIGDKEPAAWKRLLTDWMLRRGHTLLVHAATEADEARRRVPHVPVVTTFLPVHALGGAIPLQVDARRQLGIAVDAKVALSFGHVRPFKGLDIALRAWSELRTPVLLLVAGEAWWESESEYRALAKELALPVIERDGRASDPARSDRAGVRFDFRFIPDSEIATFFSAADVVLAPYRIEAQSGVALTAFHFSRPVIATAIGGLPEIIEPGVNGLLVPPENPHALASAIEAFFAGGDPMTAGAQASARKYSWPEYASVVRRLL